MDHKEKHHEHHKKEREEAKRHHKAHTPDQGKKYPLPIHPTWLLVVGIVLILAAVLVWTFLIP
jgi:hypothetical protein